MWLSESAGCQVTNVLPMSSATWWHQKLDKTWYYKLDTLKRERT
jgi:hypothetical protein